MSFTAFTYAYEVAEHLRAYKLQRVQGKEWQKCRVSTPQSGSSVAPQPMTQHLLLAFGRDCYIIQVSTTKRGVCRFIYVTEDPALVTITLTYPRRAMRTPGTVAAHLYKVLIQAIVPQVGKTR